MAGPNSSPSPRHFFETLHAFQQTEALRSAIQLEVFTAMAEGNHTSAEIAQRCGTSERGMRILCDYLVIIGFITKSVHGYDLTQDSAVFLDRRSPAYVGEAIRFLFSPHARARWEKLTEAVRKGGMAVEESGLTPEHPMWVDFARGMAPLMAMPAELLAKTLQSNGASCSKVLDLAVGHGLYGITVARHNPGCAVWAVDWASVLEVAKENASKAGLDGRYHTIPGSAFEVEFGNGYDLALITNFLHHFDPPTCEVLLRKVHAALKPGARAAILEFVPNEDRVSPPVAASFPLTMLVGTPSGDAYTFAEYQRMLQNAGYASSEKLPLEPTLFNVVIGHK